MGLSHFESVREERTYGARDGPRGPKSIVLLSRTSKGGADKAGYVRPFACDGAHDRGQKKNVDGVGGYLRIWPGGWTDDRLPG